MLKRGKEIARAVAESAGLVPPRIIDATEAAELHRAALVAAQTATEAAEQNLQATHDRGAPLAEITRLEAAHAATKAELSRAERRYLGAEQRLRIAQAAEAEKGKTGALVQLNEALAVRRAAAARIDAAALEMAEAVAVIDGTNGAISEARRDGVAANVAMIPAQVLVNQAMQRAGAIPSQWLGDRATQPTAAELAERDERAIRLPAPQVEAELAA